MKGLLLIVGAGLWLGACIASALPSKSVLTASWYDCRQPGECSRHKITASGARFSENALTAAHRELPFGTRLRVRRGARSVVVVVNDRGPFVAGVDLDLSRGAARQLDMIGDGRVRVQVERL